MPVLTSKIWFIKYAFLLVFIFVQNLYSQAEDGSRITGNTPGVFCGAFAFKSNHPGEGRIDIYVQIPFLSLKFTQEDDRYLSRIEISTTIQMKDQQVWQKNQLVESSVKDFSGTLSNKKSIFKQFSTDLKPGNYELILQVTDQESKKVMTFQKSLIVKDFSRDTLALSDIMLVRKVNAIGMQKEIVPNLIGVLKGDSVTFFLFFEIYNGIQIDSVQLVCRFINSKKDETRKLSRTELLSGNQTQVVWQIDTPALTVDQYLVEIEGTGYTETIIKKQFHAKTSRQIIVQIKDLPATITNIDKAADQLLYIAKGSEIDFIKEAQTPEEEQKRFLEFWKKREPDPKTPENELMEEYYLRVDYANKNFSTFIEGWKTDMGMVLVKFGTPENIERHPFDSDNKPYEIWYYYNQNREFIFVDETGFGDYRLRYPTTDLWGRIR